ncbi:hypothetical protein COOONC_07778, partial [Cooperia oncophora]
LLSDAFSFGVGTITTIPAVQIFCIYTCCALVLTFLYQITFFCALLSLATKWEAEDRHCLWLKTTIPPKASANTPAFHWIFFQMASRLQVAASASTRLLWLGSRSHPDPMHESNRKRCSATKFFQDWYAPILMQPAIKALAALWYCIYVGFAIYGCFHLREGLEPVNLLVDDSYAKPHYLSLERHFWHYGTTLQIVVSRAPDLRNREERSRINSMVSSFANARHAIGDQSIQFWMHEMERYYRTELNTTIKDEAFYEMASHFLYTHDSDPWMEDVKWSLDKQERPYISAFRYGANC